MIPEADDYLSFLMGADSIEDQELLDLGVKIVRGAGSAFRGLLVPKSSLPAYRTLLREKLRPGFWNDVLSRQEISFLFKLADGAVRELTLSEDTRSEIARLCNSLNKDPIEKTSDMPRYLAGNPFYRDLLETYYLGEDA